MIWLIKTLEQEEELDAIDSAINNDLIEADLRTYKGNPKRFTTKRYHPTKDLVASPFKLGKVPEWDRYILRHVSERDLVELSEDWFDSE